MAASALAPRSNAQIAAYVRSILRYMPPARSRARISRDATAYALTQSRPLMDSILSDERRRIASGTDAINQLTGQLTSRLRPLAADDAASYEKAKADSAGQSAALAEFLHAHGAAQAAELGSRTASIGAPPAANAALQTASAGVGDSAGGAAQARGGVAYDRLNADAATREAADRELPALAALAGVHAGKALAAQTGFQASQAADKVREGIPGLIGSYTTEAERENQARGSAAVSLSQGLLGQEIQKGIAAQSLGLDLTKIANENKRSTQHVNATVGNSKRSAATTRRGQDISHGDRVAALKVRASNKAAKDNQRAIATARKNSQDFAIKLKQGTLGGSGGGGGSLYGGGGGTGVTDRRVAFQRTAVYLGNALGRKLELRLGSSWMKQAVDSMLLAAGYPAPGKTGGAGNRTGSYGGVGGR